MSLFAGCTDDSENRAATSSTVPSGAAGASQGGVFAQIPDLVARVEPSVVAIITDVGQGSGVVWSAEGVVVTNNHVIAGARQVQVAFADGQRANAQVAATDPQTDLAVLRASRSGLPAAAFAEALETVEDFLGLLRARDPGQSLEVVVSRNGDQQNVTVRLGDRP